MHAAYVHTDIPIHIDKRNLYKIKDQQANQTNQGRQRWLRGRKPLVPSLTT